MKDMLEIKNLEAWASGKKILKRINLKIKQGEIHILMGPNGAGKTSLAMAIIGHPDYKCQSAQRRVPSESSNVKCQMRVDGRDILKLKPDERAKLGLFISFQKPIAIPGVSVRNLLRLRVAENFEKKLSRAVASLKMNEELLTRSLNENFSGGEGKLMELFQAKMLAPKFLILDEIDSGLDIDALRLVTKNIQRMLKKSDAPGILLITHNPRILKFVKPNYIHILIQGRIIRSGGLKLGKEIEQKGYQCLTKN